MNPPPRYDRIVSLVLLVLLGLAVVFLIDINPNILRARFGGDVPSITVSWLLIASLVVISSTGADVFIRLHPHMQTQSLPMMNLGFMRIEFAPVFWILPSFAIIASFAFFRLFSASLATLAFVLALIAAGGFLFGSLVAQHYSLDRRTAVRQRARLALQAMTLLLAFGVFSAIYYARMRTLYSATLIGASAALLAYAQLSQTPTRNLFTLSLLVGLTLAEATWAINYWSASFLIGGALLLALFHTITGILQSYLEGMLTGRVIWEYGAVGGVLLLASVYVTFR
ncbi:MAG: DUF5656 family protein [Roseiflexus sp.]